jgi:hypothetical protein
LDSGAVELLGQIVVCFVPRFLEQHKGTRNLNDVLRKRIVSNRGDVSRKIGRPKRIGCLLHRFMSQRALYSIAKTPRAPRARLSSRFSREQMKHRIVRRRCSAPETRLSRSSTAYLSPGEKLGLLEEIVCLAGQPELEKPILHEMGKLIPAGNCRIPCCSLGRVNEQLEIDGRFARRIFPYGNTEALVELWQPTLFTQVIK